MPTQKQTKKTPKSKAKRAPAKKSARSTGKSSARKTHPKLALGALGLRPKDLQAIEDCAARAEQRPRPKVLDDAPWDAHPAHPDHDGGFSTLRRTVHQGREIVVKTSYEITVDGQPLSGHISVADDGRLYSHACPYQQFDSTVDLVKNLVDLYPDSFSSPRHSPGGAH